MNETTVYYRVEELITAVQSVSGNEYWTPLLDHLVEFRRHRVEAARSVRDRLRREGRTVRLVRVAEEVVEP